jgi:hypothetical protein
MPEFSKPANERCQHQRAGHGCNIYPHRPSSCRLWNCRWLAGDDTGPRPDHSHFVVDVMPDYITVVPHDGTEPMKVPVVQVWIDPRYPDAHRNKHFRAWLDRERMTALIRFNETDAFVLAPPSVNADGTWFEGRRDLMREPMHTAAQRLANMGPQKLTIDLGEDGGCRIAARDH